MAFFPVKFGGTTAEGDVTVSTTTTVKVTLGFQPKFLALIGNSNTSSTGSCFTYDSSINSTTQYIGMIRSGANNGYVTSMPNTTANRIASINSDGFTLNKFTYTNYYGTSYHYYAKG